MISQQKTENSTAVHQQSIGSVKYGAPTQWHIEQEYMWNKSAQELKIVEARSQYLMFSSLLSYMYQNFHNKKEKNGPDSFFHDP